MSEWLDIMLEEVERKKQEAAEAEEEAARRSRPEAKEKPGDQKQEKQPD